jgi:hypothetical protein
MKKVLIKVIVAASMLVIYAMPVLASGGGGPV